MIAAARALFLAEFDVDLVFVDVEDFWDRKKCVDLKGAEQGRNSCCGKGLWYAEQVVYKVIVPCNNGRQHGSVGRLKCLGGLCVGR
ncbi:MAG: hypothetical protein HUJ51_06815 [Eggerthellaceae bacterium]|nr:hypothetical protein [Eggerthellaceae bacterium]